MDSYEEYMEYKRLEERRQRFPWLAVWVGLMTAAIIWRSFFPLTEADEQRIMRSLYGEETDSTAAETRF